jgi:hypothetical protein
MRCERDKRVKRNETGHEANDQHDRPMAVLEKKD